MCGIVGASSSRNVYKILIEGLRRLEYRGYDSAGFSLIDRHGQLQTQKTSGKVADLEALAKQTAVSGHTGIAHTRWATHGEPSTANSHPHTSGDLSIVHNGIIENHAVLRAELISEGYPFTSATDSEVIAHLIHSSLKKVVLMRDAVCIAIARLEGAYALAVVHADHPGTIICAR
ncbi:MAG: glutamine--fructose-6-phosphate aminotransferase, partial [Porticoccaceae bacterium]|nr:glutamine--fructose-6-phosphate aminotransferase [Porticoccaceae bacterium]